MDQALRSEALSRFRHTVRRIHACMEHPADAPTVVLDPDGMVSAFEDFLSYLVQNFPSPSAGYLQSQMGLWEDTCVEDWAAGKIDIEAGWTPAFLVRKLFRSVPYGKMPPATKAQSWSLFVEKYKGFLWQNAHPYSLP